MIEPSSKELKKQVIGQIVIGLVRDWLTKEVNRYLGFLAYEVGSEGTATSLRDDGPIRPFQDYLTSIDNSQLLALLHAEGPHGELEGIDVLVELTGSDEIKRTIRGGTVPVLEEMSRLFPETMPSVLAEAATLAHGAEAAIKNTFDEVVRTCPTEGAEVAGDRIRNFMTNFPEVVAREHFSKWYKEPIKEAQVEQIRELYGRGRSAQFMTYH